MTERTTRLRGFVARAHSDTSVLERALRGDPVAFSEAYRRYYPRVYAFCLSRTLDPHLAEDAAQEAFVRFLNAEPDSIESPKAWLFTVARNASIDHLRRRDRAGDDVSEDHALFGKAPDSAEELLRHEQGRQIMLALRRLRPRYRTALVMRELHHMSSEEMAIALETTPGAVDTLVSRARDAFGVAYGEVCDLPDACASTFPLIYKDLGSGLDAQERERLEAHIEACPRCQAERGRAERGMAAVLPFLAPVGEGPRGLLGRLLAQTDPATLSASAAAVETVERGFPALKIAVATVVVAIAAVPVGHVAIEQAARTTAPSAIEVPAIAPMGADAATGEQAATLQQTWQRGIDQARGEGDPTRDGEPGGGRGEGGSASSDGSGGGGGATAGTGSGGSGAQSGAGSGGASSGTSSSGSASSSGASKSGSGAGGDATAPVGGSSGSADGSAPGARSGSDSQSGSGSGAADSGASSNGAGGAAAPEGSGSGR